MFLFGVVLRKVYNNYLSALTAPVFLLLTGLILWGAFPQILSQYAEITGKVVWALLLATIGLALHYRRGEYFFVSCSLALIWGLQSQPDFLPDLAFLPTAWWQLLFVLLPVNWLLLAMLPERGVLSPVALVYWLLLTLETIGLNVLAVKAQWLESFGVHLTVPASGFWAQTLPQVSAALGGAWLLALTCLVIRQWLRNSHIAASTLVGMLALGPALAQLPSKQWWFALTVGVLFTGVIKDAFQRIYYDPLTSLPGRRALDERLSRLWGRYVIAMVDVDHFKKFNDKYGHQVGDQALKYVASQLRQVGFGGTAYRYGGEEFAIVFPRRKLVEVMQYLEDLRARIADTELILRGVNRPTKKPFLKSKYRGRKTGSIHVTTSIGVAASTRFYQRPNEVIRDADAALYKAKRTGRNKVVT